MVKNSVKFYSYLNNLTKEDFIFINEPKEYKLSDYFQAIDNFKKIKSLKGVKSICLIGSNLSSLVPGISDLDFIVVLNNGSFKISKIKQRINDLFSKYSYQLFHKPFISYPAHIKKIFNLTTLDNSKLNYLAGISPKINPYRYSKEKEISYFIDFLNTSQVAFFNLILEKKVYFKNALLTKISNELILKIFPTCFLKHKLIIDTRKLLHQLNAINRTVTLFERITNKKIKKGLIYKNKLDYLRKNWFLLKEDRLDRSISLLKEAIKILIEVTNKFADYLKQKKVYSFISSEKIFASINNANNSVTCYIDHWNKSYLDAMLEIYNFTGELLFFLPSIFLPQLDISSSFFKDSVYIDKKLNYKILDSKYKSVTLKRYSFINNHLRYLSKNKLDFGYFFVISSPYLAYNNYYSLRRKIKLIRLRKYIY